VWHRRSVRNGLAGLIGAAGAVLLWPLAATAQTAITHCGPVATDSVLVGDLTAAHGDPSPCLKVVADGITLNLNGHTVDVRALGPTGTAIAVEHRARVRIEGSSTPGVRATILASFTSSSGQSAAVVVRSSQNVSLAGLRIMNSEPRRSWCPEPASRFGAGILLEDVAASRVFSNQVECFAIGIAARASAPAPPSRIEYNVLLNDSNPLRASAGLALAGVNGWRVTGNFISGSGSNQQPAATGTEPPSGALTLLDASGCSVEANTVQNNPAPGIVLAGHSTANRISGNTAQGSVEPVTGTVFADLWDGSLGRPNVWQDNVCGQGRGQIAPQSCPATPANRPLRQTTTLSVFTPH
jgi:parallel beta-helix repeat protein